MQTVLDTASPEMVQYLMESWMYSLLFPRMRDFLEYYPYK